MKSKPISAFVALCLLAGSIAAFGQQPAKVGDLLDKGGKKLAKDDLSKLLPGATFKGTSTSSPEWRVETSYKPDGTVSGRASRYVGAGGVLSFSGKWSVNDQGQICLATTNSSNQSSVNCGYVFSLGSAYFTSLTDDRTAALLEREVIR